MLELRKLGIALMVGGLVFAGCGGGAGDGAEGDDEALPDTIMIEEEGDLEEAVEETGEAVGEAVGEGAEELGDKAEDAADAVN